MPTQPHSYYCREERRQFPGGKTRQRNPCGAKGFNVTSRPILLLKGIKSLGEHDMARRDEQWWGGGGGKGVGWAQRLAKGLGVGQLASRT